MRRHPGYDRFPNGFFDRADNSHDGAFYAQPRLVTHIDDEAIRAVGELYRRLDIRGRTLDIMSSWISHFIEPPEHLTVLGMNAVELEANRVADERIVHDLNVDPALPFPDGSFAAVTCCVSVDYLIAPLEVFDDVARVLQPGGRFVCTFSNRCFPTKAIRGWLATGDDGHCELVRSYFSAVDGFSAATVETIRVGAPGRDPLYGVHARKAIG